jgi:hypothetical protein
MKNSKEEPKPIHKFNNGRGATLCDKCFVIISEELTKELYCEKCKPQQERMYNEEEVKDIVEQTIEKFYKHRYSDKTKAEMKELWFEQFKKK